MRSKGRRQTLKYLAATGALASLPGVLSSCAGAGRDAQVIVVGAGLAGLNAAILLQDQGVDVLVVEASARVGGRVYTIDDERHQPDAGGSEFSVVSYARLTDMINRLGLETVPWRGASVQFGIHVGGQTVSAAAWPTAATNLTTGLAQSFPPTMLGGLYLPRPAPLASLDAWLKPESAQFDTPYGEFMRQAGADAEVLRLVGARANADDLDDISALWKMRAAKFNEAAGGLDKLRNLAGGMSRLTEGMAGLLNRPVRTNAPVAALTTGASGVQVALTGGETLRADYAVCSVPLTILREMTLEPALPSLQAEAVAQIPYDDHIEVFFDILEPFWEQDALPSSLWTDGELGLVLHIEDTTANGYLWLAIAGPAAASLRQLPDDQLLRRVSAELQRVRPSTAGRLKPMAVHNWSAYPWTRGHVAYRAPGQIQQFGAAVAAPHGRIHFAGEHTAVIMVGMEGAMESGERAAVEILTRAV